MKKIVVIAGVTAASKTAAAIVMAKRLGGELVGADSVQVYRGFDIGSAKPSAEELGAVQHHLLDVVEPDEAIDAGRYAALADAAIAQILERGHLPIVVGGTGLWLGALVRGLVALPKPDPALRAALEAEAAEIGAPALHARLATIDPLYAARIHVNDQRRITRALEVHQQTGKALGELQAAHQRGAPRYDATVFLLDRERDDLYEGIRSRISLMLDAGWVEEVKSLLDRFGPDVRPMNSVGYREIKAHVLDGLPLEEATRLAYKSTRTYTRRQRTWFRGETLGGKWTDAQTLIAKIESGLPLSGLSEDLL